MSAAPGTSAVAAAVQLAGAVASAIHDLGRPIPSGELYARLMGHLDLPTYEAILRTLTGAGLISVDGMHLIRWTGPRLDE